MAYRFAEIVLAGTPYSDEEYRTLWDDIEQHRIPLLADSDGSAEEGLFPVTRYDQCTPSGAGRISILTVRPEFFARMDQGVHDGVYRKFSAVHDTSAAEAASKVWNTIEHELVSGTLWVTPDGHFEAAVPVDRSPDGKAHATVYMALKMD